MSLRNPEAWRHQAWTFVTQRGWDGADREDLVQNMVTDALATFRVHHRVSVAYLQALDQLDPRIHYVRGKVRHSAMHVVYREIHDWRTTTDSDAREREKVLDMQKVLRQLPATTQKWMNWLVWEGWTLTEIAAQEGITPSGMTRRLQTVRRQLRTLDMKV